MRSLMLYHAVCSRSLARWITGSVLLCAVALVSSEVRAVPIQYSAQSGSTVAISVYKGIITPLLINETIGLQAASTITIESDTNALLGFSLVLEPASVLELSGAYGGYDEITLNSVEVSSGPAFATFNVIAVGSGYQFLASGVEVEGEYVAVDSTGGQSASPPTALPEFSSNLNGAYQPSALELEFSSVQIALLDGSPFGESEDLLVMGTFSVLGGSPVVIPEPSTGALLGLGLLILGSRRRAMARSD